MTFRDFSPQGLNQVSGRIFTEVYQKGIRSAHVLGQVSAPVRQFLAEKLDFSLPLQCARHESSDGTTRLVFRLEDSSSIESVLIPMGEDADGTRRTTLCISSQVGCAMGCTFCLTARQGLKRHLNPAEIVSQVIAASRITPPGRIVFMGMGEPLHNRSAVFTACHILNEDFGLDYSRQSMTISTSGLIAGIEALAEEDCALLAVSINASEDITRSRIMPINRRHSLKPLMESIQAYQLKTRRWPLLEYVLLKGQNDTVEDARRLAGRVQGMKAKVNLIPFNEHHGSEFLRPSDETITLFQEELMRLNIPVTVRTSKGRDVSAACGQLASEERARDSASLL